MQSEIHIPSKLMLAWLANMTSVISLLNFDELALHSEDNWTEPRFDNQSPAGGRVSKHQMSV